MELKVKSLDEILETPELLGNEELPEDKKMQIAFRKRSPFALMQEAVIQKDGEVTTHMERYTRSCISRIIKPFTLNIDNKKKRDMTIDDIFEVPELAQLAWWCWDKARKIQEEAKEEEKK